MRYGLEDTVRTKLSLSSAAVVSVCASKEELNAVRIEMGGFGGAALQSGSAAVGRLGSLLTSRPGTRLRRQEGIF